MAKGGRERDPATGRNPRITSKEVKEDHMVYVLDKGGKPLMPTERHGKVRHMIEDGRARVVKRTPFTIQLTYETETNCVQDVTLGVDAGSGTIGLSATTGYAVLFEAETKMRQDVHDGMTERRGKRRARRNRKTRYRAPRFDNRRRPEGWLTPTMEAKVRAHINVIADVCAILPISKIVVETASFDIQKIKDEDIEGKRYQEGEQLGYSNVKAYVKARDSFRCWSCGTSEHLEVHHIIRRRDGGSDRPANLITLCERCHTAHHNGKKPLAIPCSENNGFKAATEMSTMRWFLLDRLKATHPDILVVQTYGYVTNWKRNNLKLEKTHAVDARVISGNGEAAFSGELYRMRVTRSHNRCLHKDTILKGGVRKANQAPRKVALFALNDFVEYAGQLCCIHGRRSSGYFDIRRPDGTRVHAGVHYRNLTLVERASNTIIWKEDMAVHPSGRA